MRTIPTFTASRSQKKFLKNKISTVTTTAIISTKAAAVIYEEFMAITLIQYSTLLLYAVPGIKALQR